jgi:DNA-binding CsgD family transcriptional regulator
VPGYAMEDSKEFLQRILEHLSGAMKNILHPSFYEHSLREIGVRLGQEVVSHVRPSDATTRPFRQEDYFRCLEWMKRHWGWDHEVAEATKGLIGISIPRCPFGKLPAHDPHLCQIEAGMLGGIAGDHFNYAKVEICRGAGAPPKVCSLNVHFERTPQSMIFEGPSFPLEAMKVKQAHRVSPEAKVIAQLSPREQQIVRLIGEGLSDKEIAHALGLSVRTVEGHVARIRGKTDLGARGALIRLALRSNH